MAYGGDGADRSSRKTWKFMLCHLLKRLERSAAVERLERLELFFFYYCLLPNTYCLFDVNQDVALVRPGKVGERSDGYS